MAGQACRGSDPVLAKTAKCAVGALCVLCCRLAASHFLICKRSACKGETGKQKSTLHAAKVHQDLPTSPCIQA